MSSPPGAPEVDPTGVFLNCPFGPQHERLFLALVSAVVCLGFVPRCVLALPSGRQGWTRVERILALIRTCAASVHDLSCTGLDAKKPRTPRFNMPFELGLAMGHSLTTRAHAVVVLEARPYRLQKSLSDFNGWDPYLHGRSVDGMLAAVRDALGGERGKRVPMQAMRRVARALTRHMRQAVREGDVKSVFSASGFEEASAAALLLAQGEGLLPG